MNASDPRRILILDDNFEVVLLFRTLLNRCGYAIRSETAPEAALKTLETERFDLILTDMKMPGMTGLEFIRNVRQRGLETQIIVITAFPGMIDTTQFAQLQVFAYLTKPISLSELEETVRQALSSICDGASPSDPAPGAAPA